MRTIHSIVIDPHDNVATLCTNGERGDCIESAGNQIILLQDTPMGHKVALTDLAVGVKIIKYKAAIGTCTKPIRSGEWVHTHNVESDYMKAEGGVHHD